MTSQYLKRETLMHTLCSAAAVTRLSGVTMHCDDATIMDELKHVTTTMLRDECQILGPLFYHVLGAWQHTEQ